METKICSRCGTETQINKFNKNKTKKGGFDNWCKECSSEYIKKYYLENKEKIKVQHKEYYEKNKDYLRDCHNKWMGKNKNKEKVKIYIREYQRDRFRNNLNLRLNRNIRGAIYRSLKNKKGENHWEDLVGYTLKDLRDHLESQFKDGMTWENMGHDGWHIDHRIPISIFNITGMKSKGFKKCWELNNLQPMWAKENLEKYNKLFQ